MAAIIAKVYLTIRKIKVRAIGTITGTVDDLDI